MNSKICCESLPASTSVFLYAMFPCLSIINVQRLEVTPLTKSKLFPSTSRVIVPPSLSGTPNFLAMLPDSSDNNVKFRLLAFFE